MTEQPDNFYELLDFLYSFSCKNIDCKKCLFRDDNFICDILLEKTYT